MIISDNNNDEQRVINLAWLQFLLSTSLVLTTYQLNSSQAEWSWGFLALILFQVIGNWSIAGCGCGCGSK